MFIHHLNYNQVVERLKKSNLAFLPVGTVEGHGEHQPLGTDTFIAEAMSVLLARETGGFAFPTVINYSYTWSMKKLTGSISIQPKYFVLYVVQVCTQILANGFERLFLVNVHGGNGEWCKLVALELFENTGYPVAVLGPYSDDHKIRDEIFRGLPPEAMEPSMVLAAMDILGIKRCFDPEKLIDQEPGEDPYTDGGRGKMGRTGVAFAGGFYRYLPTSHQPMKRGVNAEKGHEYFQRMVQHYLPAFEGQAEYIQELKAKGVIEKNLEK